MPEKVMSRQRTFHVFELLRDMNCGISNKSLFKRVSNFPYRHCTHYSNDMVIIINYSHYVYGMLF